VVDRPGEPVSDERAAEPRRPLLRVVRGEPTPAELAALIAVVAAKAGGGEPAAPQHVSAWTERSRLARRPIGHGPGQWRASAWPS
jgi:acyl-CoA carboxylase epsilon subunit